MKGTPAQNALAVLLALGLLGALALRLAASNAAVAHQGPELMAASGERFCTVLGDTLHCADAHGRILHEIRLQALGVRGLVADLQVLANGELLIGDAGESRILRCDLAQTTCAPLFEHTTPFQGTFKFHLDEATERLFIADTRGHRLLLHADAETIRLDEPGSLYYPNRIALDANERLLVANTKHLRVDVFAVAGASLGADASYASSGHGRRPTTFATDPEGRLWILHTDGWLGDGELRVHAEAESEAVPVVLPAGSEPSAVVRLGERMLVADRAGVAVHAVNPYTLAATPFDQGAFGKTMAERAARHAAALQRGEYAYFAALAFGLAIIGLGVVIVRAGTRESAAGRRAPNPQFAPAERYPNVRWLEPDPAFVQRIMRYAKLGLTLQVIGVIGLIATTMLSRELLAQIDPETLVRLASMVAFLLLAVPMLLVVGLRTLRNRMGRRGTLLYLRDHRGRVLQIPPEEALHTPRVIAYGPVSVPLMTGLGTPFYARDIFGKEIQPMLQRSRKVGGINLMIYQLMNREPLALTTVLFIVLGGAVVIFALR